MPVSASISTTHCSSGVVVEEDAVHVADSIKWLLDLSGLWTLIDDELDGHAAVSTSSRDADASLMGGYNDQNEDSRGKRYNRISHLLTV